MVRMRTGYLQAGLKLLGLVALVATMAACAPIIRNHGYAPSDEELLDVIVGVDTRDSVESAVGRPTTVGVLRDGDWFYVGSSISQFGPRKPREIKREVVAIRFGEGDVVTNIERFGLEEGRVVPLSRRVTESNIKDITLLSQILRNFGKIDAGAILDQN